MRDLLIYDGDCQFCQLSLDWGIRNLRVFPQYVAYQRINPTDFGLSGQEVASQIWLVSRADKSFKPLGGHLAAAQILLAQKSTLWRALGWFAKTPPTSRIAKSIYAWVAKNRHRLPGGNRSCKIQDTYEKNF